MIGKQVRIDAAEGGARRKGHSDLKRKRDPAELRVPMRGGGGGFSNKKVGEKKVCGGGKPLNLRDPLAPLFARGHEKRDR